MTRTLVIVASLFVTQSALAQDPDSAFRDFVTKTAAASARYVEQWWSANLDSDRAPERVAIVCSTGKDDKKGYFLIEKDATHRWEIGFDFDSRTRACKGNPGKPPRWEQRKTSVIELFQGHLQGYESTAYALRIGQPVIVREVMVDKKGATPRVKDWDQLVKTKRAKSYQSPDTMQPLN